jgi:polyhydroxyalkanoate synthesis repressor PhaR
MTRLIKRYGNRKMYDTQASRYVTLDGVAELVRKGEDLRIVENDTGEDLTAVTFAQILLEEEKRKAGLLELPALRWIIQRGGATLQEFLKGIDRGREALENLAEKGVKQLLKGGEAHEAPVHPLRSEAQDEASGGRGLLNEILEAPQKQIEQIQQRIDTQVRASLERLTAHPTFQNELRRIEQSIKKVERQVSRLRRHPRPSSRARTTKGRQGRRA